MSGETNVTMPGKVDRIIRPILPGEPETAQISVEGADDLYKEIRIENSFKGKNGDEVHLGEGAHVEVTVTDNTR